MFCQLFLLFEPKHSEMCAARSGVIRRPSKTTIPLIPSSIFQTRERTVGERLLPTLNNAKEELSKYITRGGCSASARAFWTG